MISTQVLTSLIFFFSCVQAYRYYYKCPYWLNNYYTRMHGDKCYHFVFHQELEYDDAQYRCNELGGNLAMPKNDEIESFLVNQLVNTYQYKGVVWIGLNDKDDEGTYYWVDGTKMTEHWFGENEGPRGWSHVIKARFEDCIGLDTSSGKGVWKDFRCSDVNVIIQLANEHKNFICEIQASRIKIAEPTITTQSSATKSTPNAQPPATSQSPTQPPTTRQATKQPPATSQPTKKHPTTSPPTTQIQVTSQSVTQPPATSQSATQPSANIQPATQLPATSQSATQPPANIQPATQLPVTSQSATQPPATSQTNRLPPATSQSAAQPPVPIQPATQPPATSQSATQSPTSSEEAKCQNQCNKDCGLDGYKRDENGCPICECDTDENK